MAGGEILKDNYGPPNIDPKGVKKKKKGKKVLETAEDIDHVYREGPKII